MKKTLKSHVRETPEWLPIRKGPSRKCSSVWLTFFFNFFYFFLIVEVDKCIIENIEDTEK